MPHIASYSIFFRTAPNRARQTCALARRSIDLVDMHLPPIDQPAQTLIKINRSRETNLSPERDLASQIPLRTKVAWLRGAYLIG